VRALAQEIFLTLATQASILPRQDCRICGGLLFKGYAQVLEIKCRGCKTMNFFDGNEVRTYNVKPY